MHLFGQEAQGYVLVPTVLGGAHEWMAHLTQLALVWIAVLAMTSLVFRFGWDRVHAIAGALLLVAIAPFLPMASTAMPDILATALALVAMERLAAWKAEQKGSQGVAAAIALALAAYARPHLVLLLLSRHFFCSIASNPGRFCRRSGGNCGFGHRLSQALFCCWQSSLLPMSIIWRSIVPHPFTREHSTYETIFVPI